MVDLLFNDVVRLEPGEGARAGRLGVLSGRIVADSQLDGVHARCVVHGNHRLLTPGLIDIHCHGIEAYVYEQSPDAFRAALARLPAYGTTAVCPTFYAVMRRDALALLAELAAVLDEPLPVHVPGLHLEGPFLKISGAGAATFDGDVGYLDDLLDAARQRVRIMSISPDTAGIIPVIERLVERGVVPFITHTQATYEQTKAAMDAGARHATHFYDVFPPPEPTDGGVRPVGAAEALLEDERATVDFIADGVHVHPGVIRLALRCKGYRGVVLITDANIGAGLSEGTFDTPWGFRVRVSPDNGVRNADRDHPRFGRLAGSALTMDRGVNNLLRWLDIPDEHVWAMGTSNPARLLGLTRKGSLRPGADADLVLWEKHNGGFRPVATWVGGRLAWGAPEGVINRHGRGGLP